MYVGCNTIILYEVSVQPWGPEPELNALQYTSGYVFNRAGGPIPGQVRDKQPSLEYRPRIPCSYKSCQATLSFSSTGSDLVYIPSAQQAADGLTKPLDKSMFNRFVPSLGL